VREQLRLRLEELKAEEQAGQRVLADLDRKRTDLEATLLRIGGAIQVLEEFLIADDSVSDSVSDSVDGSANGSVSETVGAWSADGPPVDAVPVETMPAGNGQQARTPA
jgi:hypothetical protein